MLHVVLQKNGNTQESIPSLLSASKYSVAASRLGEAIDVSDFYGRTAELATLKPWIVQDSCRLVTLSGMGGEKLKLIEQVG